MRPGEGRAARGERAGSAKTNNSTRILASHADLGNCLSCGQRIKLVGDVTTCPSCRAWRRWGEGMHGRSR
jgi:hypothetical protein